MTHLNREEAVEKLIDHYQAPYCCRRSTDPEALLAATAFMHLVSDRKILSIAKAGVVESDDFVYLYSVPELTPSCFNRCCEEAKADALDRIDPNPNHNFSLISVFFLCDRIAPETGALLKKEKFRKDYHKPEYGWAELRLAAIETGSGTCFANPMGKALLNLYRASVN